MTDTPTPAEARLERAISETAAALADGKLDVADLPTLIRNGIEVADTLDDLSGAEKRALAERYVTELVDEVLKRSPQLADAVADLDIPLLPDWVERAVVDPAIRAVLPDLLRPLLVGFIPGIVDLVVDATKGGVAVNRDAWEKVKALADHGDTIREALGAAMEMAPDDDDYRRALAALQGGAE